MIGFAARAKQLQSVLGPEYVAIHNGASLVVLERRLVRVRTIRLVVRVSVVVRQGRTFFETQVLAVGDEKSHLLDDLSLCDDMEAALPESVRAQLSIAAKLNSGVRAFLGPEVLGSRDSVLSQSTELTGTQINFVRDLARRLDAEVESIDSATITTWIAPYVGRE